MKKILGLVMIIVAALTIAGAVVKENTPQEPAVEYPDAIPAIPRTDKEIIIELLSDMDVAKDETIKSPYADFNESIKPVTVTRTDVGANYEISTCYVEGREEIFMEFTARENLKKIEIIKVRFFYRNNYTNDYRTCFLDEQEIGHLYDTINLQNMAEKFNFCDVVEILNSMEE